MDPDNLHLVLFSSFYGLPSGEGPERNRVQWIIICSGLMGMPRQLPLVGQKFDSLVQQTLDLLHHLHHSASHAVLQWKASARSLWAVACFLWTETEVIFRTAAGFGFPCGYILLLRPEITREYYHLYHSPAPVRKQIWVGNRLWW